MNTTQHPDTRTPARLDDFGEPIAGARKDRPRTSAETGTKAPSRPRRQRERYAIYGRGDPVEWAIARRAGSHLLDVHTGFASRADACAYRDAHRDELNVAWPARLAATRPVERHPVNRTRIGPAVEAWDGDGGAFVARFGLRGVQFGASLSSAEQHEHVHATTAALTDLADALHIAPARLGFGGTLGIAFGARGRGGVGPTGHGIAAHYEPRARAINLTRRAGAGSLAHEWAHGLDHLLGDGDALASGAVRLWKWWPAPDNQHRTRALGMLDRMPPALAALSLAVLDSPVYERSRKADGYRSARYYSTLHELLARAVERAVVAALADDGGRRNDYLANVREGSPVHATIDEARKLIPLVRAAAATLQPSTEAPTA